MPAFANMDVDDIATLYREGAPWPSLAAFVSFMHDNEHDVDLTLARLRRILIEHNLDLPVETAPAALKFKNRRYYKLYGIDTLWYVLYIVHCWNEHNPIVLGPPTSIL